MGMTDLHRQRGRPEEAGSGALLARTARGAGWVVGWRMVRRLIGLMSTLVLAHLLVPADFGLVALGASLAGSLDAMAALGVEEAIVRDGGQNQELYDTAFTLNALRGFSTAVLLIALAPSAGTFFHDRRLSTIMIVLAGSSAVGGLTNIGIVEFLRSLEFQKEFVLLLIPRLASLIVTVIAAYIWRNYTALLLGIVTSRMLSVGASYVMHPYRPRFSLRAWRRLASFSFWTWMLSVAQMVRDRMYSFVVGRALGIADVGVLNVGIEIADLPTTEVVAPLGRACFAGFAAARHAGENLGESYVRVVSLLMLVILPSGVGISAIASPLVELALGPRWLGTVPIIEFLGIAFTFTTFGLIAFNLLSAAGMLRKMFATTTCCLVVRIGLLAALLPRFGLIGAVVGGIIGMFVEYGAYTLVVMREFGIKFRHLVRDIWRSLLGATIMAWSLYTLGMGWTSAPPKLLAATGLLVSTSLMGSLVYCVCVGLSWVVVGLPNGPEWDLIKLVTDFAHKFSSSLWARSLKASLGPLGR